MIQNRLRKIFNNAYVFSLLAKLISIICGVVYSILYSRYLGAELRGTASIISNYSEIISIILCFGIFQAYPYYKHKYNKDIYNSFVNNIYALFLIYLVMGILISSVLGFKTNYSIAFLIAPFWMTSRQLNYIVLIENPKLSNKASILMDGIDLFTVGLLYIVTNANLKWCIFVVSFKQIVFFFICIFNIHKKKIFFSPSLKGILPYFKYGLVPMITMLLMEANYKMDVLMLEWFKISNVDIGIYSLGVMLAQKVWMIPDAIKDILLSKLVNGKGKEEVAKVSRISFVITLLCELVLVVFGRSVIILLYGKEYTDAYFTTIIICAGVVGMVFYKMIYSYNVTNGYKNTSLLLLGLSALINVVLNSILIPVLKSNGAGIASLISYTFCGVSFLMFFCKKTNIKPLDLIVIKKSDLKMLKNLLGMN